MRLLEWVLAVVVAASTAPGGAVGEGPGDVPSLELEAADSHCVVEVVEQRPGGELVTSEPVCFGSFADAMVEASGGLMRLPDGVGGDVVFTDESVGILASTFAIGIHYDGYNGSGSSITVVGSSCSGGYWNTPGWFDNRISSSYNGCARLKHWNYPGVSGYLTATTGVGTTDNLPGSANNKTESVSYHSS